MPRDWLKKRDTASSLENNGFTALIAPIRARLKLALTVHSTKFLMKIQQNNDIAQSASRLNEHIHEVGRGCIIET